MYKQIANATNREELHNLQIELIDRFGLLPQPVKHFFLIIELKWQALELGIKRINAGLERGKIEFDTEPKIDAGALIKLIQLQPKRYQLDGPTQLKFNLSGASHEERIHEISALLNTLSPQPRQ